MRKENFLISLEQIEEHNSGDFNFKLGLNYMADWNQEQIDKMMPKRQK